MEECNGYGRALVEEWNGYGRALMEECNGYGRALETHRDALCLGRTATLCATDTPRRCVLGTHTALLCARVTSRRFCARDTPRRQQHSKLPYSRAALYSNKRRSGLEFCFPFRYFTALYQVFKRFNMKKDVGEI
jgi:hypothetical protein